MESAFDTPLQAISARMHSASGLCRAFRAYQLQQSKGNPAASVVIIGTVGGRSLSIHPATDAETPLRVRFSGAFGQNPRRENTLATSGIFDDHRLTSALLETRSAIRIRLAP
ncbi:MAG: hypothetical protein JNM43_06925 [Planctomycetaceae bacterium]|nr:hypothetical protein [Planctomycetaceae bacterium]